MCYSCSHLKQPLDDDGHTADMRPLPFADASIDAVISSTAIHNICDVEGRPRALDEIVRVLHLASKMMIDDIHTMCLTT